MQIANYLFIRALLTWRRGPPTGNFFKGVAQSTIRYNIILEWFIYGHIKARWLAKVYVAAVSPARDESASYVAWGHSSVVCPWGKVIATTDHKESVIYADIGILYFVIKEPQNSSIYNFLFDYYAEDLNYLNQVRQEMPLIEQRRLDVYKVIEIKELIKWRYKVCLINNHERSHADPWKLQYINSFLVI